MRDRSGVRLAGTKSFSVKISALANYLTHHCTKKRIYFTLYVVGIYVCIYVLYIYNSNIKYCHVSSALPST
jgi:hypothetical protein